MSLVSGEVAASFCSGGFSDYFACPDYQNNALSTYLQNLDLQYYGALTATIRLYLFPLSNLPAMWAASFSTSLRRRSTLWSSTMGNSDSGVARVGIDYRRHRLVAE